MICLITTIGYLIKYLMNFVIDYFIIYIYKNDKYDKRLFLRYTMYTYIISLFFSTLLYQFYKVSIFGEEMEQKKDTEGEDKNKNVKISQICGYIIYSERMQLKDSLNSPDSSKKNCCVLCCESFDNCCDVTFCHYLYPILNFFSCGFFGEISCQFCKRCRYRPNDYEKNEVVFRYCYKAQRKSYWCNKFFTNETQEKIFPHMIEYFLLVLLTVGFEKQYEKYKNQNIYRKTWITIFISTFILFLYLTLSFAKTFIKQNEETEEEIKNEKKGKEIWSTKKNKKESKIESITKFSNEIINGTHAIVLFNGVFSLVFSSFYLSYMSEDIKSFFFKDNINIILMPILMNKFYYFTLNYYCIYTSEKEKKFELISSSSLISFYIAIWNLVITLIKFVIPDENVNEGYNYFNILYIIQIIFSIIPSFIVALFLLLCLIATSGIIGCFNDDCSCQECREDIYIHKFLFCLCSFICCLGGIWIKADSVIEYTCECYYCDFCDKYCEVYCLENVMFCNCCCCNNDSICYKKECYNNCNYCKICGCFE